MEAGIVSDQKRGGVYSELKKRILLGTLTADQGSIIRFAGALSKSDEPDPQLVLLLGVALARGHHLQDGQNIRTIARLVRQNPSSYDAIISILARSRTGVGPRQPAGRSTVGTRGGSL